MEILSEAKRCLQCKKPRCVLGCPVSTPIKDIIGMLIDGKTKDAGKILFDNNPLSVVCSLVCPRENQCEKYCVLNAKGAPVQIGFIENHISDTYINSLDKIQISPETVISENNNSNRKKVAIIGSGPAGITIATLLSAKNYDITIFEGNEKIGGVLRYGIPEFRLPKRILDKMAKILINSGVKIRPNTTIGINLTLEDLYRDGFSAIFMGTGVWKPRKLGVRGESLGNVHFAIDYLKNPNVYLMGQKVAVIGAGNVAMDAARTLIRQGAKKVVIISRDTPGHIKARKDDFEMALLEGAEIIYNKAVIEVVEEGVVLQDLSNENSSEGVESSQLGQLFECDSVIVAIGQGPRSLLEASKYGIKLTEQGLISVDDYGRTTCPGVFASGDVVTGAKTVVEAVKISKRVAEAIELYLNDIK